MTETYFIFDMDGTLYNFDNTASKTFGSSRFYQDLKADTKRFIAERLGITTERSNKVFDTIMRTYDGELSIGLEKEFGIDRYELFANTWDRNPDEYLIKDIELQKLMAQFVGRAALLTAAPRIWADNVLEYLGLNDIFGDRIYTGEPDLRKPDPEIFWLAGASLTSEMGRCVSIGDQNYSDILPAKSIGMQTALIGPDRQDADFSATSLVELIQTINEKGML